MCCLAAAAIAVLVPLFPAAQEQVQQVQRHNAHAAAQSSAKPLSKAEQERARQALETAQARAGGFEAPLRAFVDLQIGETYAGFDPAQAVQALRAAFSASVEIDPGEDFQKQQLKSGLQRSALEGLLPLAPGQVEELLPQAEREPRARVSVTLVERAIEKKDFDDALARIDQVAAADEFPYDAATALMLELPAERGPDFQSLFARAAASYQQHEHKGINIGGEDLATMVIRFWRRLPPHTVQAAIDELLKQAKGGEKGAIAIGGAQGAAGFSSDYEYRLFQVLPVLEQLDPERAKSLLADDQQLRAVMDKYPQGLQSLDPGLRDTPRTAGEKSQLYMMASGGGESSAEDLLRAQLREREQQIVKDSAKDPRQAIAAAAGLPGSLRGMTFKSQALEGIARANLKRNPSAAKDALDELRKSLEGLPLREQATYLSTAADLYLQLGEKDTAEKTVGEGLKIADKLFQEDSDANDPNQALKAYWPSADAWRRFLGVANKISPRLALTGLKEISDPEMRTIESIYLARAWAGVPLGMTVVAVQNKKGNWIMMGLADKDKE